MTIRQHLDLLAVSASFAEPDDEAGLNEVLQHLQQLQTDEQEDVPEVLARVCTQASERIQALLRGEPNTGEGLLEFLSQVVEFAQEVVDVLDRGDSAQELLPPWEKTPSGDETASEDAYEIDPELLEMFVSQCDDTLKEVEGQLLSLEENPNDQETISEIRRRVHTFKGECGVLSLATAQALCHEAETLIERTEETGSIPVDLLLDLVDWLGRHVQELRDSPLAKTSGSEALLQQLQNAGLENSSSTPEPSDTAQAAPAARTTSRAGQSDQRVEFPSEALEDEMLPEFIEESNGHLEDVEAALLERQDDPEEPEIMNRIFRSFHTIKGVAGFLNLDPLVRLAHKTETLLDEIRSERVVCTDGHIDLIFRSKDILGEILAALAGDEAPLVCSVDEQVELLDRAISGADTVTEVLEAISLAAPEEIVAAAEEPDKAWRKIGDILLEHTSLKPDALELALEQQSKSSETGTKRPIGELLVELGLVTKGDLNKALAAQTDPDNAVGRLMRAEVTPEAPKKATKAVRKQKAEAFVKVGTQRLDALVDMVGELVIAQQMVQQDPALSTVESETLSRKLGHAAKITRDLQEGAMSLRMVTLKSTFQKMARLVRDVSGKSGKDVKLKVMGEDTELDRNVVEQIGDPLVHLIRNSIDHGLEPVEERRASGKPANGTLTLAAYHQGGSIVIDVTDNGRGLDCDRIFQKGLERGLIPPGTKREELSDDEIHRMIFQAGFSTAATVSDISGRGVGMDVVRRNIESMRGKVEIRSEKGKGSTMTLRLPLTLAIIDGMIVRVGSRPYVIPTLAMEQSFRPESKDRHGVMGDGETVDVRGSLLPVHKIKRVLNLPDGTDDVAEGILTLLESNGRRACFLVDEILGQQQVVIKSLGKGLPQMQGVSGGAILGDGRVALILDVDGLLNKARGDDA